MRFIIEGTWSGYTKAQAHVVHRMVYPSSRKKLREWASKTHGISYSDGTMLYLDVRDCTPRERVQEKRGYESLINDCFYKNVNSVMDLK